MGKKRRITRLHREYYVVDEYGHSDKILVQKVNELIDVVNQQQEVINTLKLLLNNGRR